MPRCEGAVKTTGLLEERSDKQMKKRTLMRAVITRTINANTDRDVLVDELINAFETYFIVGEFDMDSFIEPHVTIKSDNTVRNTLVSIGGHTLNVRGIRWSLRVEDQIGDLRLTFS